MAAFAALTSTVPSLPKGATTLVGGETTVKEPLPSLLRAAPSLQAPAGKSTLILPLVGKLPAR